MKIVVNEENQRIDKYLSMVTDYSRAFIQKLLDESKILVNDHPVKASYSVKQNDEITIIETDIKTDSSLVARKMDLDILYEDDDILVINKPSGLVVHPGSGNVDNTLANGLLYYTESLSDANGMDRPGIVHRLDKDTSGLLVVAKNNKAHEGLANAFSSHQTIEKEYLAIVNGVLSHNHGIIDAPIGRDTQNRKKMCVTAQNSKNAVSEFTVLERFAHATYVKVKIQTGRTHQIRVHMQYIGHPILNDPVYSNKSEGSFGQYLHAYHLSFLHPITQEKMDFTAPLPSEFTEKLKELREEI